MKYRVAPIPGFYRQVKIILKKYPRFIKDLEDYFELLENTGPIGRAMPGFPALFKDRLAIKSHNIGERGEVRIISYHDPASGKSIIVPLLIYLKSDLPNPPHSMISAAVKELRELIDQT